MSDDTSAAPSIAEIEATARRLRGRIRRTPMIDARPARHDFGREVRFKLENLQVSGSFKARGATSRLLTLEPERLARGLITASGGNHGLGVAYAACQAGVPAAIYLPRNTPAAKADKLRRWGAEVVMAGEVWDDANQAALAAAEMRGMTYVHPFADPAVIAGQGTLGLEIIEDAPDIGAVFVAIGGGGLISGVATAIKARRPDIRVIGVEPVGAPTLHDSLQAGRLVTLERIATRANTLAPRRSEPLNFSIIRRHVDQIALVTDEEMERAASLLWFEYGLSVELSAAAGLAALMAGRGGAPVDRPVCVLVCGAGSDGISALP